MKTGEDKRILLIRTDRLGDVVLTTPAIHAVRQAYPKAYIAVMVRPYAELVIKGNPYVDEVIVYDQDHRDRSMIASLRFALALREKRFDIAVIFHPTNRAHIITYLAGIRRRIGYDKRFGFLLTERIEDTKRQGLKHEIDYSLDMLRHLAVEASDRQPYIPISDDAHSYTNRLLADYGIGASEDIVTIHPSASCPSKIWPLDRFAELTGRIIDLYGVKVVLVAGDDKRGLGSIDILRRLISRGAVFIKGGLDVQQLAVLLKRSKLFISNDSGPVHVAVSVKTPVLALFGRNQPGLSPRRWGPIGPQDMILHKDVGCVNMCLAHDCKKGFACLEAISVDDVLSVIKDMAVL